MIIEKYISGKSGFTFVEIIVVITIISLISVNSIFYFNDFIGKQELSYDISELEEIIKTNDTDIKNQNSFDYSLFFKKNSYGYSLSQNSIGNNIQQEVSFDTISGTGTISLNPSSVDIWEIKIFKGIKKTDLFTKNGSENIGIQIQDTTRILGTLSGSTLNTLTLGYFDVDKESKTKNTFILDIRDSTATSYDSLKIQNISGNKEYYFENTKIIPPIEIFFEKNGIESILELN